MGDEEDLMGEKKRNPRHGQGPTRPLEARKAVAMTLGQGLPRLQHFPGTKVHPTAELGGLHEMSTPEKMVPNCKICGTAPVGNASSTKTYFSYTF